MNEQAESTTERESLRAVVETFLNERLTLKLEAQEKEQLKSGTPTDEAERERADLRARYSSRAWIADAAERARQIRGATHIPKATHPESKASSIAAPSRDGDPRFVGTSSRESSDVVGNAAALDVHRFLMLRFSGETVLARLLREDVEVLQLLDDDVERARELSQLFIDTARQHVTPRAHSLTKQTYFPVDGSHHLLAPMYPSVLMDDLRARVVPTRYGEVVTAARTARREGRAHPGYVEHTNLLVQMFGSGKPQNISKLMNDWRGEALLLASCPPAWRESATRPLLHVRSIFRPALTRHLADPLTALRDYLKAIDHTNASIREGRRRRVVAIVDAVLETGASLRALPSAWSSAPDCALNSAERIWLDTALADRMNERDWMESVSRSFGRWLNAFLASDSLPLGDAEQHEWSAQFLGELELRMEDL